MASESTVKDSQPSLDLASATSGDKIVTAQVGEYVLYLIQALNFLQLTGLLSVEPSFFSRPNISLSPKPGYHIPCPALLLSSGLILATYLTSESEMAH